MQVPKDPVMLLSFVNLKLRDYYSDLETMCSELEIDRSELEKNLGSIGYFYQKERNQFL